MNATERRITRLWDGAVLAVCREIETAREEPTLAEDHRRLLCGLINQLQSDFRGRDLFARGETLAGLARIYGASERTISYWKAAGCPFSAGQWKVLDWLFLRRVLPGRTRARFARQLASRRKRAKSREFLELVRYAQALVRMLPRQRKRRSAHAW